MVPKKEMQLIAEKLADYAAAAGIAFEQRVANACSADDRFEFLRLESSYRPYYEEMLRRRGVTPVRPAPSTVATATAEAKPRPKVWFCSNCYAC